VEEAGSFVNQSGLRRFPFIARDIASGFDPEVDAMADFTRQYCFNAVLEQSFHSRLFLVSRV
jgi:hypothetical protein